MNIFYGIIAAFSIFLLVSGIASFGAVITCTLYIIKAIENLKQDLNRDKDPKRDDR